MYKRQHTPLAAVESTTRFAKIRHGGEFAVNGPRGVPAGVEGVGGGLRAVFVFEAGVDVADEVYGKAELALKLDVL